MDTLDKVLTLAVLLAPAALGFYRAWENSKKAKSAEEEKKAQEDMLQAVMVGVQLYKNKHPGVKEELDASIKGVTTDRGLEERVKPIYKKTTSSMQIPKLMLLGAAMLLTGCVNAAIHDSAVKLQKDLDILNRATVANPAYSPSDAEKVDELKFRCLATVNAIEEASR